MKNKIFIFNTFLILVIALGLVYIFHARIADLWDSWMAESAPEPVSVTNFMNGRNNSNSGTNLKNSNLNVGNDNQEAIIELPEEFNLDVPFTTQSPYAAWTEQDNESCEEATALIVHYYWQNKTFTKEIAKHELQKIVDFENNYFGFYKDTNAAQTAEFIKELWGYRRVDVRYGITLDDIKKEVAQGRPVIVPTAGRMLGNPNFRQPGPLYHMLVIRGWTEKMIITNDPGTRKGEGYQYNPNILYNAIHDWNNGDVDNGRKTMIVVWPNK